MFALIPQAMPEELLATTPPMVQAISLAGSGPSAVPCRRSRALTLRSTAPGPQRTRAPSSSTSTSRKPRRVSASTPSVTDCPDRLVPPERKVTEKPCRCAARSSAATSSTSPGVTTADGVSR